MFLGTLEKGDVVPYWPNYLVYYESVSEVSRVYLRVIMRYFEKLEAKNVRLEEKVRFYRKYEEEEVSWKDSNNLLCDLIVKVDGEIGDSEGYLEVDFANAVLSFGRGGTQEEILLGMSPESHVIVLIADELTDRETILLQGITKIAKHSGFGLDLKYEGIADPWDWNRRFIIAMDAMSFPDPDPFSRCPENAQLKEQLQLEPLHRELLKVHCAYNFTSKFPEITGWPNRIATGGWGCGSFNGHHHLKSIIQILAASQCSPRTTLVYHAFGNAEFAEELQAFLASCPARSVGSIYRALLAISARLPNLLKQSSPLSLFDEIRRQE
uniref:PARG catalytic Macro domain-containing protein n=1 Tax=Arcella intermedia TaxID=1963864 RepID=A0A6B2L7R9_9EUKA